MLIAAIGTYYGITEHNLVGMWMSGANTAFAFVFFVEWIGSRGK